MILKANKKNVRNNTKRANKTGQKRGEKQQQQHRKGEQDETKKEEKTNEKGARQKKKKKKRTKTIITAFLGPRGGSTNIGTSRHGRHTQGREKRKPSTYGCGQKNGRWRRFKISLRSENRFPGNLPLFKTE